MAMEQDLQAAIRLVEEWNARGYGEYLLWEVLTGQRERPFPEFFEIDVSDLMLGTLCRLQTEHKIWFTWVNGKWRTLPIEKWEAHAATTSAAEARDRPVST